MNGERAIDRVMVDIETLGTEPGCAILSIGAVAFDESGLQGEFYRSVDLESCTEAGLTIDGGTLSWWLNQDEGVQDVLTGGFRLRKVLKEFQTFCAGVDEVWAFSPSFDCDILSAAYDAVELDVPWGYRDERCARTIDALPISERPEQEGDAHNALDDARNQARLVSRALARMPEVSTP